MTNEDEVCAIDGYVSVQENHINPHYKSHK